MSKYNQIIKKTPFHEYQNQAIDYIMHRYGVAIFARPGKGKTRIALEVIKRRNVRTLIIAPLFPALTVWTQEAEKWGYDFTIRVMHGKNKYVGDEQVSVINYDGLAWLLKHENLINSYDFIVYDELSKMKHPGSNRFRRWRKYMPTFKYRLGLTGTPLGNKLIDLWGEMYTVGLDGPLGRTKEKFQIDYFIPHPNIKNVWEPRDDSKNDIFKKIKPYAMSLDYNAHEMPSLTHNKIHIALPKNIIKIYEELKKSSVIQGTEIMAVNAGVKSIKLRQIAAGAVYENDRTLLKLHSEKQQALSNLVNELQGDPILVFFEFKHDLDAIRNAFSFKVPSLDGSTKPSEMIKIVNDWNAGKIQVLAAHPKTAGMGGNMQKSGCNVCFYTMPWSLEDVEQCIDRVWRQGQTRGVIVHYLMCEDTKDFDVFDSVKQKSLIQNELFNVLKR